MSNTAFRTLSLGGTLLVIKGMNDCATIERGKMGRPVIVEITGDWTKAELREALEEWNGSDAQKR